jgi:hypothetical protein
MRQMPKVKGVKKCYTTQRICSPLDMPQGLGRGYFYLMPQEPQRKRVVSFIDGQNLFYAAREAFGYTYPNYDVSAL